MELTPVSEEADRLRETIFRLLFGKSEGYVCIAYLPRFASRQEFREQYFRYPTQMPAMLEQIATVVQGHNVWFCPQLLESPKRNKENVSVTTCAWADLDSCPPELLLVEPTLTVESSPNRYQAFWVFEHPEEPAHAEDLSQRIAYKHADDGADRSGWDLTQLLRVPFTFNYKYMDTPLVRVHDVNKRRYRLNDFIKLYPPIRGFDYLDVEMPSQEVLDSLNAEEILQKNRLRLNPRIWNLFQEEPKQDWSSSLWALEMLLFEAGFERNAVFAIAREAACNKYARDNLSESRLWKEVCRAEAKYDNDTNVVAPKDFREDALVSEEERARVVAEGDTFVERYIAWARTLGDAAVQYHQAGAFIALSSILAGAVRLPTSFGQMHLNLWFMILADTTLTRKSTAMDIAMDLVAEVDSDAIMATDGSLEGLLTTLQTRPSKPSVFLRDEFSGLLEQITKRDYLAGMAEMLTKLYDGKLQKRVLRKEVIEVKDPILIVFAGGIKNKVTGLLTFEHVSSGFMPRFIYITAESDVTKIKPLGPPTDFTLGNRTAIMDELLDMSKHYNQMQTITITGGQLDATVEQVRKWDAILTPEAWHRYNVFETQMLDAGMSFDRPEIMTPTYDRLSKSTLKAAVLLAASRQRSERVVVEEIDMLRAIVYCESWRMYVRDIMNQVGKTTQEKQLEVIVRAVMREPGIGRSKLMQWYHLTSRDTDLILSTLEQRQLIRRQKTGRQEQIYPYRTVAEAKIGALG